MGTAETRLNEKCSVTSNLVSYFLDSDVLIAILPIKIANLSCDYHFKDILQ